MKRWMAIAVASTALSQEVYETDRCGGRARLHVGIRAQARDRGWPGAQQRWPPARGSASHRVYRQLLTVTGPMYRDRRGPAEEPQTESTLDPVLKRTLPAFRRRRSTTTLSENSRSHAAPPGGASEILRAAGAPTSGSKRRSRMAEALMEPARMGTDPARSVVNDMGAAAIDVKNLFIVMAASFVTAGRVNPREWIQSVGAFMCGQHQRRLTS